MVRARGRDGKIIGGSGGYSVGGRGHGRWRGQAQVASVAALVASSAMGVSQGEAESMVVGWKFQRLRLPYPVQRLEEMGPFPLQLLVQMEEVGPLKW